MDIFEPFTEPAKSIYRALVNEQSKRSNRTVTMWIASERRAVFNTAKKLASSLGLNAPTMEQVIRADNFASGHSDYTAQFVYSIANIMYDVEKV